MYKFHKKQSFYKADLPANEMKGTSFGFWLCWMLIVVVYVIFRLNLVDAPLERDEGGLGYIGQVILDKGIMYRDVFDMKPPGGYYLYALALLFVPPTAGGIHMFLHVYNFLTLITLFFTGKVIGRSNTAGLWVAFIFAVVSSLPDFQAFSTLTEMLLLFPLSLSLFFTILALQNDKHYLLVFAGIFAAMAFWTKAPSIIIAFFIVLYLLAAQIHLPLRGNTNFIKLFISLFLWGGGFILASLLVVGFFYYHGAFDELIYWCFTYSFFYGQRVHLQHNLDRIYAALKHLFNGNFPLILMVVTGNLYVIYKRDMRGLFALGFLFFSLLATMPGYAYLHYFAQLAPAMAIAGGFGFYFLAQLIKSSPKRVFFSLLYAAAIVIAPLTANPRYYIKATPAEISHLFFGDNPFPESVDIARYLKERTTKDDTIYIYGAEPQIFFYSERKSATSIASIYPLMSDFPRHREFQQKTWDEINAKLPSYIVMVNIPTSLLYDGKADLTFRDRILQLLDDKYMLDAFMTLGKTKGGLIPRSRFDSEEEFTEAANKNRIYIRIHKRK